MSTPAAPRSRTLTLCLGLGVLLIAALFTAWWLHRRHFVWTNDAYLDGYQVSVSSDIEARIITLFADEGDLVRKGDLLCQLDESILNSKKLDAETFVAFLEERVKLRKIEMEKLRDIYLVARAEFENEIVSYLDFDKAEKDFRFAEAQYKAAEAQLTNGKAKLGVLEELLQHTKIFAPCNGAISKRWVVAGNVVQIGQPLFSLTELDSIWVTANLEETKVGRLKAGDRVAIHIDAYPHLRFTGTVFAVRAAAASQFSLIPPDNASGNFTKIVQRVPVKIWLDAHPALSSLHLYPGMSVEIDVRVQT